MRLRPLLVRGPGAVALGLAPLLAGCLLASHFDRSRTAETTDALCSDGVDNDGDGLADCQDWKCLGRKVCCTMPVVLLTDDFKADACSQQSCAAPAPSCAPDPARWSAWGVPLPLLCEGGLSPHKNDVCYDVCVLGAVKLAVEPGLVVTAHVVGAPEAAGRLEVGLTLQDSVGSGPTACSPVEGVLPAISIQYLGSTAGGVLVARFDGATLGAKAVDGSGARHEVRLAIDATRRVGFLVDGETFAQSPADQPLPKTPPSARVSLSGRGLAARFDDVTVTDGTQCESPGAWQPESPFAALQPSSVLHGWDSFRVSDPALAVADTGDLWLYYTGCRESVTGGDCSPVLGVGRARSRDGVTFTRDGVDPRLEPITRSALAIGVVSGDQPAPSFGYISTHPTVTVSQQSIFPVDNSNDQLTLSATAVLGPATSGTWDDGVVCCMSIFQRGTRTLMWYAGHSVSDPTWQIGLAVSTDGGASFARRFDPVLRGGDRDAFDGHGVRDPMVVWDADRRLYRMWYRAEAFLGLSSVGYAVSTDGEGWHKFPANPVVTASDLNLIMLGRPAVHVGPGEVRLWVHGEQSGQVGRSIFGLVNRGAPPH